MAEDYQEGSSRDDERAAEYRAVLDVSADASPAELRAAYRRLAFRLHPDRNPAPGEAAHREFLDVSEAFAYLLEHARELERSGKSRGASVPRAASDWDWSKLRTSDGEPPVWSDEAHRSTTKLREQPRPILKHRTRVRALARELALSNRRARLVERGLLALGGGLAALALLALIFALIGSDTRPVAELLWASLIAALFAAVCVTWCFALREGRMHRCLPYAEELLRRREPFQRGAAGDDSF